MRKRGEERGRRGGWERASQQHVGRLSIERSRLYVQFLFRFFLLLQRNIPGGNVVEMGSCGMDIQVTRCRRESRVSGS